MAAKRIGIMDIRQLLQLKLKGFSNRKIATTLGIHRNSINHYVRLLEASKRSYESLLAMSDQQLANLFPSQTNRAASTYETLSRYFEYFRSELKKPGCTRQQLWQNYLVKHPDGYAYTQFNFHFNAWLKRIKSSGKLFHKAGEKMFVDYTGKKLTYQDKTSGQSVSVEVFVAILPCSNYTFAWASHSQNQADFIDAMNQCLRFFGGVPQVIITDNLKAAVTKASKYEPTLNKTFKDFALHYGCAINPTRSHRPQDKALVEGTVKLVYQRIFYPLNPCTFFSLTDLNKAIGEQLMVYNNDYKLSHLNLSRKQQFTTIEQSFLQALPKENYEIRYYKRAKVQKMGYVYLHAERNYYSVPYRYIGKQVEIRYNSQIVEIHYNSERICSHKRNFTRGKYITNADHLSSTHQFYSQWSPAYFEQQASNYGTSVVAYIKVLIQQARYPEIAYKQCLGIFALSKTYSLERLNKACQRGLGSHRYSYSIIKNILVHNMDVQAPTWNQTTPKDIEPHANIRGEKYYQ